MEANVIARPASSTGSILFGGIDTAKYHGDLTLLSFYPTRSTSEEVTAFWVALSGVRAVSNTGSDALGSSVFPARALLDSGTSETYLPDDLVAEIFSEVNARFFDDPSLPSGLPIIPCAMSNSTGYLSYQFGGVGGPMVNVSMNELVNLRSRQVVDGTEMCEFTIQPASNGPG